MIQEDGRRSGFQRKQGKAVGQAGAQVAQALGSSPAESLINSGNHRTQCLVGFGERKGRGQGVRADLRKPRAWTR